MDAAPSSDFVPVEGKQYTAGKKRKAEWPTETLQTATFMRALESSPDKGTQRFESLRRGTKPRGTKQRQQILKLLKIYRSCTGEEEQIEKLERELEEVGPARGRAKAPTPHEAKLLMAEESLKRSMAFSTAFLVEIDAFLAAGAVEHPFKALAGLKNLSKHLVTSIDDAARAYQKADVDASLATIDSSLSPWLAQQMKGAGAGGARGSN